MSQFPAATQSYLTEDESKVFDIEKSEYVTSEQKFFVGYLEVSYHLATRSMELQIV